MFSSSGRDTSSWVHTWGHGKGQEVSYQHALCHVPASLAQLGGTEGGSGNSCWVSTSYVSSTVPGLSRGYIKCPP